MTSKIIQKEKEEQKCWLEGCQRLIKEPESGDYECGITKTVNRENEYIHYCFHCNARMGQHRRFLINLKEYMELSLGVCEGASVFINTEEVKECFIDWINTTKEDIKKLQEMIEKYG